MGAFREGITTLCLDLDTKIGMESGKGGDLSARKRINFNVLKLSDK